MNSIPTQAASVPPVLPIALVVLFILLSGVGDALGFVFSGRVWQDGQFVWTEALKAMLGFQFGVAAFWVALRYLRVLGVVAPEMQTMLWFGATIVGVALLSGRFAGWHIADQLVAAGVLLGIGWLLYRNGGIDRIYVLCPAEFDPCSGIRSRRNPHLAMCFGTGLMGEK